MIGCKSNSFLKVRVLAVKLRKNINVRIYLQITSNPEKTKALTTFYKLIYKLCIRWIISLSNEASGTTFHRREV